jgi:hypothetical protein
MAARNQLSAPFDEGIGERDGMDEHVAQVHVPLDRLEEMLRAWDDFEAYVGASARERILKWRAAPRAPAVARPELERLTRLARHGED